MTRTMTTALLLAASFAFATPAFAQAPSEAQREAIKSNCRNDYIAHCSSVPPGGAASLECLQKNMSSLSASCASAVRAVEAPAAAPKTAEEPKAEPKTEPKAEPSKEAAPAAKEAKPAEPKAASTGKKPSQAQISAIRTACRSDYPKVCAGVPTGGAPALECLEKNKGKVSAACAKAVAAAGGGGGGAPAAAAGAGSTGAPAEAAAPAAAAPTVIVLRPMLPREELFVLRSACGGDVRTLCGGVPAGGGRIMNALQHRQRRCRRLARMC